MKTYLIVFYNKSKTCYQVIKPQMQGEDKFSGDWEKLAQHFAPFESIEIG